MQIFWISVTVALSDAFLVFSIIIIIIIIIIKIIIIIITIITIIIIIIILRVPTLCFRRAVQLYRYIQEPLFAQAGSAN